MSNYSAGGPVGTVVPLFPTESSDPDPAAQLEIDDLELELVIACGLALRDVAERLEITMEDVCAELIRLRYSLRSG